MRPRAPSPLGLLTGGRPSGGTLGVGECLAEFGQDPMVMIFGEKVTDSQRDNYRPIEYAKRGQCGKSRIVAKSLWRWEPDNAYGVWQRDRYRVLLEHLGGSPLACAPRRSAAPCWRG